MNTEKNASADDGHTRPMGWAYYGWLWLISMVGCLTADMIGMVFGGRWATGDLLMPAYWQGVAFFVVALTEHVSNHRAQKRGSREAAASKPNTTLKDAGEAAFESSTVLRWTYEKPAMKGWYFYRWNPCAATQVYEVGPDWTQRLFAWRAEFPRMISEMPGMWAGPIKMPLMPYQTEPQNTQVSAPAAGCGTPLG